MAIATTYSTCVWCGESIALRTYANGTEYGVKLWTSGNGQYPGDQKICESHILSDDIGSFGKHKPNN